jgi:hypothetical protein
MARVKAGPSVDPEAFTRWRDRTAKFLRVATSDGQAHARVMAALSAEVEAAHDPYDVRSIDGLPEWVRREAEAIGEGAGAMDS